MIHSRPFQAIVTKFLGPTNARGSRVKATAAAGSVIVVWDHAVGVYENHAAAAQALIAKMEWEGEWVPGGMPDETGEVFVRIPHKAKQCK